MSRQQSLLQIFSDFNFLYNDLNQLITQYDCRTWEVKPFTYWEQKGSPNGILNYQHHLYVCDYADLLLIYNTNGKKINERTFDDPHGIDIDTQRNLVYIADKHEVTLLNLQLSPHSSWRLPTNYGGFRAIKIDDQTLYLTIFGKHCIFLCNSFSGNILKIWSGANKKEEKKDGSIGSYPYPAGKNQGEFNYPHGLTVTHKYVFICDSYNHRIQILTKDNGKFFNQWRKGFSYPKSIYYHDFEEIFYIGDYNSIQLWTNDMCIQRFNSPGSQIYGICVIDDRLYVSDYNNKRVQIFKGE